MLPQPSVKTRPKNLSEWSDRTGDINICVTEMTIKEGPGCEDGLR